MGKIYGMAFGGVLLAGFAAFGMQAGNEELHRVATALKLSDVEFAALRQCHNDMRDKHVVFQKDSKYDVPDEICGCQARTMAKVLKPDGFGEHSKVADAAVEKKSDLSLDAAALNQGYSPAGAAKTLMNSLSSCAVEFKREERVRLIEAAIKSGHPELVERIANQ